MTAVTTPKHLSHSAAAWFQAVVRDYKLEDHELRILELAATTWDRAAQARMLLEEQGLIITDRFGVARAHPAVAIERDTRLGFARLVREMNLSGVPDPDVRVPRLLHGGH